MLMSVLRWIIIIVEKVDLKKLKIISTMTKQGLVEALAKVVGTKKLAGEVVDVFLQTITKALKKGEEVVITGFGSFKVVRRKSRTGRNPQTGETIKIPARKVVKFTPGSELRKAVK